MDSTVIMIVEDDFLNRRLTKKILQENGYAVLEAKNADEAMAILNKELVDLAILDINLGDGEMDGITLGTLIQNKQKQKSKRGKPKISDLSPQSSSNRPIRNFRVWR